MLTTLSSESFCNARRDADSGAVVGTSSNPYALDSRKQLDLKALAELQRKLEELGPPPSREYRIHPDDLAEIQRFFAPMPGEAPVTHWLSLRLIPDADAPRLPRLKGTP